VFFQVVARRVVTRNGTPPRHWEYYPYWAPGRDGGAAERLAQFAAQSGHEAAILQATTVELLEASARAIVEREDLASMPALRYVPGEHAARAGARPEHQVETVFLPPPALDPYDEGPDKAELDRRRLELELSPAGDVTVAGLGRHDLLALPGRMDVLSAWLRLRERVERNELGGPADGVRDGPQQGRQGAA
jgi:hypothetical protein